MLVAHGKLWDALSAPAHASARMFAPAVVRRRHFLLLGVAHCYAGACRLASDLFFCVLSASLSSVTRALLLQSRLRMRACTPHHRCAGAAAGRLSRVRECAATADRDAATCRARRADAFSIRLLVFPHSGRFIGGVRAVSGSNASFWHLGHIGVVTQMEAFFNVWYAKRRPLRLKLHRATDWHAC
jgi:hypothetical protein